jgi:hypothetical protein
MTEKSRIQAKKTDTKRKSPPAPYERSHSPDQSRNATSRILSLQQTAGNRTVQRMLKSGILQAKLRIGQPNDVYEREADRVAERVMRMPEPKALPVIRPLNGPARIQRNVLPSYEYIQRLQQARRMYDDFIRNAERYGLPARFLRRVGRDYSISFGSSSEVNYWLNTMTLEESDLHSASQMAPTLPFGESSAIRTIYEEATHAYLDLVSNEPRFSRFIAAGERHYQGARTTRGMVTSDPGRVFQEAAANYVAHRVANWWLTFESLSIFTSMASSDAAAAGRLRQMNTFTRLRDDYDRRMAEVVFGYSEEGGFLGIGSGQAMTTRAMTGEMKAFLDHELLENKIPDRFESVNAFQEMRQRAGITLSAPAPAPAPAVQRKAASEVSSRSNDIPPIIHDVLHSPGQPLEPVTRSFFEPRFGYDFGNVRVHTNSRAAESARVIDALAYTLGNHIVFNSGQFSSGCGSDQRLLAHELTHVLQQTRPDSRSSKVGLQHFVWPHAAGDYIQRTVAYTGESVQENINPVQPDTAPVGNPRALGHTSLEVNGTNVRLLPTLEERRDLLFPLPSITTGSNTCNVTNKNINITAQSIVRILTPPPWSRTIAKSALNTLFGGALDSPAACSGAGNTTVAMHGMGNDQTLSDWARRGEMQHAHDNACLVNRYLMRYGADVHALPDHFPRGYWGLGDCSARLEERLRRTERAQAFNRDDTNWAETYDGPRGSHHFAGVPRITPGCTAVTLTMHTGPLRDVNRDCTAWSPP